MTTTSTNSIGIIMTTCTEGELLVGMLALGFAFPFLAQMSMGMSGKGAYAMILDYRKLGFNYRAKWVASRYDKNGHETHRFIVLK